METTRKEFIKGGLYFLLALFGLGFLAPGLTLFFPAVTRSREVHFFPLLPEEEIPRSGVKKAELVYTASGKERKTRVFIVSSPAGVLALSAVCSHLGCLVNYSKEKGEFICPCHGGRYDLSGGNIAGPPPAPLTSLPFKLEQGTMLIGVKV